MLNTSAVDAHQDQVQDAAEDFRPSRSCAYEGWTVVELKKRAKQLGISGYSGLNKEQLIELIRRY